MCHKNALCWRLGLSESKNLESLCFVTDRERAFGDRSDAAHKLLLASSIWLHASPSAGTILLAMRSSDANNDEPILRPRDFIEYGMRTSKGLSERITDVLLCYDDGNFRAMVKELEHRARIRKRIGDVVLLKDSQMALVGRFGIGAPAVVAKCEELIACGARRIISLGTAATIQTHGIDIGDVVVCKKAFSDEGTSRHYFAERRKFRATNELVNEVRARLNNKGLRCKGRGLDHGCSVPGNHQEARRIYRQRRRRSGHGGVGPLHAREIPKG